jgi:hypothetical protein
MMMTMPVCVTVINLGTHYKFVKAALTAGLLAVNAPLKLNPGWSFGESAYATRRPGDWTSVQLGAAGM